MIHLPPITAVVIAGGRGSRLGGVEPGDKAGVAFGGVTLLKHTIGQLDEVAQIVAVGPKQPTERRVHWCQEDPPGAGPPAALAAAGPHINTDLAFVVGVDAPFVAGALHPLFQRLQADDAHADVAALVSGDGGPQPLAALWRTHALRAAVATQPMSLRSMFDDGWIAVADAGDWAADIDTPADLERLRARYDRGHE